MDEHDLVGLAVFVKVICHGTLRRRQRNMQVLIYQNSLAAFQVICLRGQAKSFQTRMTQMLLPGDNRFHGVRFIRSEERRVGKECSVRVDLGGRRIIKKKKKKKNN